MTIVEKIVLSAAKQLPKSELEFNTLKRAFIGDSSGEKKLPTKTELLSAYHSLLKKKRLTKNVALEKLLTRRAVRSLSGVAIVTSLVKPYPCPGECVYCPLDERMPKSYLSEEPAAMRALTLKFDPYDQMAKRIEALENNGHPTDKIEFILKGGTWNSYPLAYQYWFILKSFEACNTVDKKNPKLTKLTERSPLLDLKKALTREQHKNETAKHRIIGLTLETRPDCITPKSLLEMREQGCTRLELGIQHTDDDILKLTKRGHTAERSREATELARNFGYKVDFHLMPQLPDATPKKDLAMMESIFTDPGFKPDMIKIYPCTVVKGSELYDWFTQGKHRSYPTRDLIDTIKTFKSHIPRFARISRLIRDIPGQYIEDGNKVTNLRQVIETEMKRDGLKCQCLRCREIGHVKVDDWTAKELKPVLFVEEYETRGGMEYFLSFEDALRRVVFAFCRLRIVDQARRSTSIPFTAYIRELHTYGQMVRIGKKQQTSSQHKGLGKKLVALAEKITKKHGIKKLVVISGVGVRGYYRSLGYRLKKTYMVKNV